MFEQAYWPTNLKLSSFEAASLSHIQRSKMMADLKAGIEKAKKDLQALVDQGYEKWHVYEVEAAVEHGTEHGLVFIMHKPEAAEPFGELAVAYEKGYVDASNALPISVAAATLVATQARQGSPFVHPKDELEALYKACLAALDGTPDPDAATANKLPRNIIALWRKADMYGSVQGHMSDYDIANHDIYMALGAIIAPDRFTVAANDEIGMVDPVAALKHDTLDIYKKILAVDDADESTEEYVMALQDALAAIRPHLDTIIAHMEGRTLSTATKDSEE